ncbi:MAG TPA: bifunctional diaminohydroxyphosphoribosylaminopyrimidine deaminase/5-amino-6-(5-phosphoribosylamino)uracil reductase RibD, partial [Sphingomicrobium sp.]
MREAARLGEAARGRTAPNPNVGCVIVKDGEIVGKGATAPGGRPHAEAVALKQAGGKARGATLYTTLEPCAHASERGPTCAALIPQAGIARVVIGIKDPDSRTAGEGIKMLKKAGIEVKAGAAKEAARDSLSGYMSRIERGRPRITLKLALSIDGKIALPSGESKWITGEDARAHVHLERAH